MLVSSSLQKLLLYIYAISESLGEKKTERSLQISDNMPGNQDFWLT